MDLVVQSGQEGPLSPPPSPKKAASVFADALAGGTEALDDPFDFDELTAELEALPGGEPARPAGSGAPPPATKQREREEARAESSSTAGPVCLPCFFLYGEEERAGTGRSGAATTNTGEGPCAGGAESEEEGGGLTWAGEAWEEDKVLRPGGPDAPFLKFAKALARCPDQCLRLGFKAQLEWPGNTPPVPPPCEACGAVRVYEMQLMSPVLAALDEMQEWGLGRGRAPPASWAWLTVAVFTCGAGCSLEKAPGRATKEWLAVALE
ncbi:hypothetical protein QBZ16_001134 [Prototheca wickerhamii]|uniref:Programmed cell death protein 2 C-terminal domain-containing protein n=1 Tax=Prototheca wickerhamii TaxID=3111 RepID=A0AAD9MH35_PROWI|nr:hypothetical protein QBZ16_001134 [Prototheca wickerhamii]